MWPTFIYFNVSELRAILSRLRRICGPMSVARRYSVLWGLLFVGEGG